MRCFFTACLFSAFRDCCEWHQGRSRRGAHDAASGAGAGSNRQRLKSPCWHQGVFSQSIVSELASSAAAVCKRGPRAWGGAGAGAGRCTLTGSADDDGGGWGGAAGRRARAGEALPDALPVRGSAWRLGLGAAGRLSAGALPAEETDRGWAAADLQSAHRQAGQQRLGLGLGLAPEEGRVWLLKSAAARRTQRRQRGERSGALPCRPCSPPSVPSLPSQIGFFHRRRQRSRVKSMRAERQAGN